MHCESILDVQSLNIYNIPGNRRQKKKQAILLGKAATERPAISCNITLTDNTITARASEILVDTHHGTFKSSKYKKSSLALNQLL